VKLRLKPKGMKKTTSPPRKKSRLNPAAFLVRLLANHV